MLPRKFLIGVTYACFALYMQSAIVKAADTCTCYHCEYEDCEDPVVVECKTVKENCKCFIRFEPINKDVVELGCLSDSFEEDNISELIKNKTLYVCEGVNCNDFAKLPNPNQCTECSSSNEEACAIKPTTIGKVQSCNNVPYTQCYQRIIGQVTERGCLYDLESDEFYKCLIGGDGGECQICEGKNCNQDIIPSDRKRCHRCSSETDASCEKSPAALSVCPIYNEKDACVAIYENGITKRGCQSEIVCDPKSKNCQVCLSDGCNTANIKRRFDDIYGIFQDLPLNCNSCKGDGCEPGKPLFPNKCEGEDYQDCMTVFDASGKVIRRGCENLVLAEQQSHCDSHPELCFRCKANACNNMTDSSTYEECLYCDATINPDCLFNPSAINTTRKCSLGCVASLYPRKSNSKVLDLVRTCFEDIEPDNYESCTAEKNCIKCSGDKCNNVTLPAIGRPSCLHCEGSDCDTPTSKHCIGYNPNDMCYIYFDNVTLSAVRLGCRSDVPDDKLRNEIKQYFVCDGDDCNDFKNLPEANFCLNCDSEKDVNCAIDPLNIAEKSRCGNLPYTQCFTRIRDGGYTERGCLSKLPTDIFISCHDGHPNSMCRICTDDSCNKIIFPGNRHWCYRCNSNTDSNCEYSPKVKQYCPRYQEEDACVTQYINGTTLRDCASEISCEGLDYKNCRKCSNYGCNTVNLSNEDIGDVGIFTHLPLHCHQCTGTEECKNLSNEASVCKDNINQSCTTGFNAAGAVLARGCSDSLENICSREQNVCFNCKSNYCNIANKEIDYIDCIHCDARNGDDCSFNVDAVNRTRKCYKSCMTALYPRTNDDNPVYELIRTCLDDKDVADSRKCESSSDPKCISCTSKKCNRDDLGSRKSCYHCRGADCQFPKSQTCRAVMDNDQCFQKWDESGTLVEMGCKSKYDPPEVETLVKRKYMWLCDEDNCNHIENTPKPEACVICNSKSDTKCAIKPNEVLASTTCSKMPYTQCYSRVLDGGHTERGCLSNLEDVEFLDCLYNKNSTRCLACTGNTCNQELYPPNRLACHACSSISSSVCETSPDALQVCLLYAANDKCTTVIDINGNTVRGCSSKVSCRASNITVCEECVGDACNKDNLKRKADGKPGRWQSLPLTCLSCNNSKQCSAGSSQQVCSGSEYCMTVFDTNGKVEKRGCSSVVEKDQGTYCDLHSSNCLNCNSNLCNKATSLNNYIDCIYCDSETNPDCALNSLAVKNLRKCKDFCMTALYPTANNYSYNLVRTCLDDKDSADQIACSNGRSKECESCSTSVCNTHKLPESRLSCYHCQDETCEDAQKSVCAKYKSDDQCFIQFNNMSDIVRMGCISDLGENFVSNNTHILYMCNAGDNCNGYENIPTSTLCAVCNSNDDDDGCADNPSNVAIFATCSALPNTQCYTKVNIDGSTQRGCVNSLNQIQINACLGGTDTDCSVCATNKCNTEIFPANRRSCQRCNTEDNPECESSPNFASICPVYSTNQFCATKLVNGHTYRGCSTEFQCDDSDKQRCRLCHGSDNCNIVSLASNNIGYPGNWQGVPINCYTCKNEECNKQVTIQACRNNIKQNCVTVFAPNGTVVQRGCSDLIYTGENLDYCDDNPENCKFCKSNGCNFAKSLADFGDCVFCEGVDNANCIFHPENITRTRSCYKGCMTGLYPRKYEENPAYELTRGCWDDLDLDDREDCKAGIKPYCQICDGTSCNTAIIPEHRLKCNVCNGADCDKPESAECTAFRENDQCFTLIADNNDVESMGCASHFDNSELSLLARQLLLCDGDNCNNFESFPNSTLCRSCNSVDHPECASNPATSNVTDCHYYPHTECYTRVDMNGVTHRGCLSDIDDDVFADCSNGYSNSCEVCTTNNCNVNIYPEGRRSCIQCDSDISPDCEDNPKGFATVCTLYDENDSCVTKLVGDRTIRGCASEISCGANSSSTCQICNADDNCNTINLLPLYIGEPGKWQQLPLSCYQCDSEECGSGNGTLSKCEDNNLQTCMSVFDANGVVVQRGCSDAVMRTAADYCNENSDKCFACKSNACNNAKSLDDYIDCYFCDSSDSSTCSVNFYASKTKTRKCQKSCMVALYPGSSGTDPSYELTRTCLDDMDSVDREKCAKGNKYLCEACHDSRCNTMNIPKERFECYKCSGDDCEDMTPQQCSAYHANDQCYTLFNNESSIVAMGCRSEFEMHVVNELVKQKRLLLCNEKKCNAPESLPTPKVCSMCNSAENPLCATNPNLVNNIQRCAFLPYTECFTRINIYGHTERGCLASLEEDDFYGCVMNTYGLCETCVGDKCNEIDIYPKNRRKCQQCSSANDTKCSSAPSNNRVCELYKEDDYCVTNIRNGVTTRGCRSETKCDNESDPRTCRTCLNDGCNTINMEKVIENGFPGRWQDIPITCHTCKDEEECSKSYLRPCENNPFQNCMTVFNSRGQVAQKGCSDIVELEKHSYCEENPDKCLRCNSNGCNEATNLDQYVECAYCDTDDNGNCVSNVTEIIRTRLCYKFCMSALYPRFKEENPSHGLSRSCYDDMDVDDRKFCAAGIKEHCKVCNTTNCNVIDMPEKRHNCYICEGKECQIAKAQKCPTYRPYDKCFMHFDESNEVVAFGCRSQFSNSEADYLLKKKRLLLCNDDSCNSFDSVPAAQICALCNSRTDKNCAVNPIAITGETECGVKPFTSCYTRVLTDGATERGCLSNLHDDEFLSCLNGTSPNCESCNGKHCNKAVFPKFRRKCHVCDSNNNSNCEASPDSLSICSIYDPEDNCVTAFHNNVTYRGCSSSLPCDVTDPRTCQKCSGDGCNTVVLAEQVDNNFGMWQDLPLTCLSCSGNDCNSEETTTSLTCKLNNEQDCMTVFDDSGKVIARGCSDIVKSRYCAGNEDNCYNCKSNKCNWASSKSDYEECIYCNSYDDQNCVWNPVGAIHKTRKCHGGCMTALYPLYNSANSSYELIRTCLNDKESSDQNTCSTGKDRYCSACSGHKCNTNSVPEDRLSCFACKGNVCEEPETKRCPLYKENDQCFIKFNDENSVSEMGCISSFRNQDLESIIKTKRVYTCFGSNCNNLDKLPSVQLCAVCDSITDTSCAVNPTGISTFNSCSMLPYTSCYSKLTESGGTERGCLTDLPADDFVSCVLGNDKNCGVCSGSVCNRETFPADRQQCFTCTSTEDTNCDSFPTTKKACPIVSDSESCISTLSGNVTIRGCKSLVSCDANDSATCRSCFGSECNAIDLLNKHDDGYHGVWQDLPLKCHTCEGEHCLYSLGPTVICSTRNINQDCMTVFDNEGRVERRGCSDDVEDYKDLYCRENPERCFKCKSNECNIAWISDQYVECLFCDSANEPLCVLGPDSNKLKSRKCYKNCMVAMKSQQVIRSCLDDKEMWVQHHCQQSDSKECAACSGDKCNNFTFPGDRLQCHICTNSSCHDSISQYCEPYDSNDFCFAKYEKGLVSLMGCASSQNASDIAEWTAQDKLHKCEENDCNELSRLPKEEVCVSCDSNKTLSCAQNPLQVATTEICPAPNAKCVSRIDAQGHTIRGCFSSLNVNEQSCEALGTCAVCTGEKCNNQIYPADRHICFICNSAADENCRTDPSSLKVCPIYDVNDKCVSTLDESEFLQRGCTSQVKCSQNDKKYCDICKPHGCNTIELKGSANVATNSLLLTLLMAIVSALVLKY